MVQRTARSGQNAGNVFWGCSNYPQCRGIINLQPT
jgi:restriction system protein